jgi:hypothetical protein
LIPTLGMVLSNIATQVDYVISENSGFEAKPNQEI